MDRNMPMNDEANFTIKDYVWGVIPNADFTVDDVLVEIYIGMNNYKLANVKLDYLLLRILEAYKLGGDCDWSNVVKKHPRDYEIILEAVRELEKLKLVRFNKEDNSVSLTKYGSSIVVSFKLELVEEISRIRAQYNKVRNEYIASTIKKDADVVKMAEHKCGNACPRRAYVEKPLEKAPKRTRVAEEQDVYATFMELNRSCASLQFAISDLMLSAGAASGCSDEDIERYFDMIHELTGNIVDSEKVLHKFVTGSNHCA